MSEAFDIKIKDYSLAEIANFNGKGKLFVSKIPGRKGNLEDDIKVLKEHEVKCVLCLVEWREMAQLKIIDYPRIIEENGIIFYHLPIRDTSVPCRDEANIVITLVLRHMIAGNNILVHCREGYGRAGTIAACILTHFGIGNKEAVEIVRENRIGAIQSSQQEAFIREYGSHILAQQS